jgi:hypothetical protein
MHPSPNVCALHASPSSCFTTGKILANEYRSKMWDMWQTVACLAAMGHYLQLTNRHILHILSQTLKWRNTTRTQREKTKHFIFGRASKVKSVLTEIRRCCCVLN